jgi:hypothetical protein
MVLAKFFTGYFTVHPRAMRLSSKGAPLGQAPAVLPNFRLASGTNNLAYFGSIIRVFVKGFIPLKSGSVKKIAAKGTNFQLMENIQRYGELMYIIAVITPFFGSLLFLLALALCCTSLLLAPCSSLALAPCLGYLLLLLAIAMTPFFWFLF